MDATFFRNIDLYITFFILAAALLGAWLSYREPVDNTGRFTADSHAMGYVIIAATIGPVVTVRFLSAGGIDVIDPPLQVAILAFGHTFALVLVLTVLVNTVKRVRSAG